MHHARHPPMNRVGTNSHSEPLFDSDCDLFGSSPVLNSQTQQGQNEQSCSESLILDSHYDIFATSTLLESLGQQLLNEPNRIEIDKFDSDNKLFASSTSLESQRQQGLNETSREPVVYESDYDLFASSPPQPDGG